MRSIVSSIGAGPTLQFTPMTSAPRAIELRRELLRRRAVEAVAVFLGRHLRDDRQVGHRADRGNRRADLVHVAERLEHEQVDAAVGERLRPARGSSASASSTPVLPHGSMRTPSGPIAPATYACARRAACARHRARRRR